VSRDGMFMSEEFAAGTAAELFDVGVHRLVQFQITCRVEALRAPAAEIRLNGLMTNHMSLESRVADELLRTNVTHEPSTFVVRLQQMGLELVAASETD